MLQAIRQFRSEDSTRIWEHLNEIGTKVNEIIAAFNTPTVYGEARQINGFVASAEIPLQNAKSQGLAWTSDHGGGFTIPKDGVYAISGCIHSSGQGPEDYGEIYAYKGSAKIVLANAYHSVFSDAGDSIITIPMTITQLYSGNSVHLGRKTSARKAWGDGGISSSKIVVSLIHAL